MNRRDFLKASGLGLLAAGLAPRVADAAAASAAELARGSQELGPILTDVEIRTSHLAGTRKAAFFIDDVIFILRDLTRQRPKSMFDHPFLGHLKECHDRYGLKMQLNLFYRTDFAHGLDEFSLADMTDAYKDEWQLSRDWIRFSFHSLQEFPDYPFVNISYEDMGRIYDRIFAEVKRFAGDGMFAKAAVPHWLPVSKAGCRALADRGVKVMSSTHGPRYAYSGDPNTLPYGHAARLEDRRTPEAALYWRGMGDDAINSSICSYNHVSAEQAAMTLGTFKSVYDRQTGMQFKKFVVMPMLNLQKLKDIEKNAVGQLGKEFFLFGTHEQRYFPDYYGYDPVSMDKTRTAVRFAHEHGYEFIFIEDAVD